MLVELETSVDGLKRHISAKESLHAILLDHTYRCKSNKPAAEQNVISRGWNQAAQTRPEFDKLCADCEASGTQMAGGIMGLPEGRTRTGCSCSS